VDLTGYTKNERMAILAYRPAPVQVSFLGYPGTSGATFVDYLIADRYIIPPEHLKWYTEKVLWLPDSYMPNDSHCPQPPSPGREACGLPETGTVFCCFNQCYKISPVMFDVWCRLLNQVPDSVLWLRSFNTLAEGNLRKEAEKRGVGADRLVFDPFVSREDHFARLQCADIFLDTMPYNAHATCSDALWMGVPVVTLSGETFASRVAGSLLTVMGLPELITCSVEDYCRVACELATDHTKRGEIRARILANRIDSPLFNSERFTRNLEALYCSMAAALSA
jgi:predicted O-linked N-acetylglucosamine transferase (SPINDLY family)